MVFCLSGLPWLSYKSNSTLHGTWAIRIGGGVRTRLRTFNRAVDVVPRPIIPNENVGVGGLATTGDNRSWATPLPAVRISIECQRRRRTIDFHCIKKVLR